MWFASALKMRDKISRKRQQLGQDEEKPFLEHLDDLRKTLTRIIFTLLIAVIGCFVFNKEFFDIVQEPLHKAGLATAEEKHVPLDAAGKNQLTQEQWMRIHAAARGASALEPDARQTFFTAAVPDAAERAYAEAFLIYRAASELPEAARAAYTENAVKHVRGVPPAAAASAAKALLAAGTGTSLEKITPLIQPEALAVAEPFMLSMKLSLFAGIIVSFPLLFYFLMEFILPGLTSRERRMLWPSLAVGFGLFLTGVYFAFTIVVPEALIFFKEYGDNLGIRSSWRIGEYISFVTQFCLIFGLSFELPVVVMAMVKLGLLESSTMRRTRAWAIVIIVVAAAILTPTGDLFTLSLLAGPMIVMYEICIWMAYGMEKKAARLEKEERERDFARRAALVGVAGVQASARSAAETDHEPRTEAPYAAWRDDPPSAGKESHPGHEPAADAEDQSGDSWDGHPHHPDPSKPTADQEYEQYMREHAHLFPPAQTHPESVPVEERDAPASATPPPASDNPDAPAAAEAPGSAGEPGAGSGHGNSPDQPGADYKIS